MLECSDFKVYVQGAPTHLGVGFSKPRASANGRSLEASFFTPKFYDGLNRGASARRSRSGIANFVKSVTLLLSNNGGSSLNLNEDTIMDDVRHAVWLFSQLSDEDQQFILIFLRTWIEFKEANNGH